MIVNGVQDECGVDEYSLEWKTCHFCNFINFGGRTLAFFLGGKELENAIWSDRAPIFLSFPSLPTFAHPFLFPLGRLTLASSVTLQSCSTKANRCTMLDAASFLFPSSPRTLTIHASPRPHSAVKVSSLSVPSLTGHNACCSFILYYRCCIEEETTKSGPH